MSLQKKKKQLIAAAMAAVLGVSAVIPVMAAGATGVLAAETQTLDGQGLSTDVLKSTASFSIPRGNYSIATNGTVQVTLNNTNNVGVSWKSSDESVATVNASGVVTGKKMGMATITATSNSGDTTSCKVWVNLYAGIDVSTYNNATSSGVNQPVDWSKVAAQGYNFAIIRSSYGWENFPTQNDATFAENVKGAVAAGIPYGLYHFSYAETVEHAKQEADYFLKVLSQTIPSYVNKMTIPVAYDMETSHLQGLSGSELNAIAIAFCEKIQQAGYQPMIYSSGTVLNKMDLTALKNKGYKIWYAHPQDNPDFTTQHTIGSTGIAADIWQFSDKGIVAGASTTSGYTDLNVMYYGSTLNLDTNQVTLYNQKGRSYDFAVKNNKDTANLKVESANASIASVALADANDSRGAIYRITPQQAGQTEIKVTYKGETAIIKVTVQNVGGSITLDTANYTMKPGDVYTIGADIRDASGNRLTAAQVKDFVAKGTLKVRDSRTGSVATLQQAADGNFNVIGKKEGTTYILYEINGTHASIRIDVKNGVKASGTSVRNTSYWAP